MLSPALHLRIDRRGFLRCAGGFLGGLSGLHALAAELRKQDRACILLWMSGGPSQFETFDPKPGSESQGPTRAIATSVPGLQIAEHWTETAKVMKELAVIRSMTGKEGNHGRATYLLHTSYPPSGGIVHPGFGAVVAKELGAADFDLPPFVSIAGPSVGSSFLGVRCAPFVISDPTRPPDNLPPPVTGNRLERRLALMRDLEAPLERSGAGDRVRDHRTLYRQTARMVLSPRAHAFDLERERAGRGARALWTFVLWGRLPDGTAPDRSGRHLRRGAFGRLGYAL